MAQKTSTIFILLIAVQVSFAVLGKKNIHEIKDLNRSLRNKNISNGELDKPIQVNDEKEMKKMLSAAIGDGKAIRLLNSDVLRSQNEKLMIWNWLKRFQKIHNTTFTALPNKPSSEKPATRKSSRNEDKSREKAKVAMAKERDKKNMKIRTTKSQRRNLENEKHRIKNVKNSQKESLKGLLATASSSPLHSLKIKSNGSEAYVAIDNNSYITKDNTSKMAEQTNSPVNSDSLYKLDLPAKISPSSLLGEEKIRKERENDFQHPHQFTEKDLKDTLRYIWELESSKKRMNNKNGRRIPSDIQIFPEFFIRDALLEARSKVKIREKDEDNSVSDQDSAVETIHHVSDSEQVPTTSLHVKRPQDKQLNRNGESRLPLVTFENDFNLGGKPSLRGEIQTFIKPGKKLTTFSTPSLNKKLFSEDESNQDGKSPRERELQKSINHRKENLSADTSKLNPQKSITLPPISSSIWRKYFTALNPNLDERRLLERETKESINLSGKNPPIEKPISHKDINKYRNSSSPVKSTLEEDSNVDESLSLQREVQKTLNHNRNKLQVDNFSFFEGVNRPSSFSFQTYNSVDDNLDLLDRLPEEKKVLKPINHSTEGPPVVSISLRQDVNRPHISPLTRIKAFEEDADSSKLSSREREAYKATDHRGGIVEVEPLANLNVFDGRSRPIISSLPRKNFKSSINNAVRTSDSKVNPLSGRTLRKRSRGKDSKTHFKVHHKLEEEVESVNSLPSPETILSPHVPPSTNFLPKLPLKENSGQNSFTFSRLKIGAPKVQSSDVSSESQPETELASVQKHSNKFRNQLIPGFRFSIRTVSDKAKLSPEVKPALSIKRDKNFGNGSIKPGLVIPHKRSSLPTLSMNLLENKKSSARGESDNSLEDIPISAKLLKAPLITFYSIGTPKNEMPIESSIAENFLVSPVHGFNPPKITANEAKSSPVFRTASTSILPRPQARDLSLDVDHELMSPSENSVRKSDQIQNPNKIFIKNLNTFRRLKQEEKTRKKQKDSPLPELGGPDRTSQGSNKVTDKEIKENFGPFPSSFPNPNFQLIHSPFGGFQNRLDFNNFPAGVLPHRFDPRLGVNDPRRFLTPTLISPINVVRQRFIGSPGNHAQLGLQHQQPRNLNPHLGQNDHPFQQNLLKVPSSHNQQNNSSRLHQDQQIKRQQNQQQNQPPNNKQNIRKNQESNSHQNRQSNLRENQRHILHQNLPQILIPHQSTFHPGFPSFRGDDAISRLLNPHPFGLIPTRQFPLPPTGGHFSQVRPLNVLAAPLVENGSYITFKSPHDEYNIQLK